MRRYNRQRSPSGLQRRRFTQRHAAGGGFTLAELLAVMLIMLLLMSMAVGSFYGMGRGARIRGAVTSFNAALALTRQHAITRGAQMELRMDNRPDGVTAYRTVLDGVTIRPEQYLPPGMRFVDYDTLVFLPNGGLENGQLRVITIHDEMGENELRFTINGLTGLVTYDDGT